MKRIGSKRIIGIAIIFVIAGLSALSIILWFGMKQEKKRIIDVEGFEIEYEVPDTWIGSGMLRPIYFLKDNRVVVLHFKYPATSDDLQQIVLVNKKGESRIIKENNNDK